MSKNIAKVILDQIELNLNVNELLFTFVHFYCNVSTWAGYF